MMRKQSRIIPIFAVILITSTALYACVAISDGPQEGFGKIPSASGNWMDYDSLGNPLYAQTDWWYSSPSSTTYTLYKPSELAGLAFMSYFHGLSFEGKTFILSPGTFDMSAHYWEPMCDPNSPFVGTLKGDGAVIWKLYVNQNNSSPSNRGFIGAVGHTDKAVGSVMNITLSDVYVTGTSSIGAVAGYNKGLISNCHVTGTVQGTDYTGGIAGYNEGIIENSMNWADVTGNNYTGGIAGCNIHSAKITSCQNMKNTVKGNDFTGGIAGYNGSRIDMSFTHLSKIEGRDNTGGIAGLNPGTVENCFNAGTVKGRNVVGGIAGDNTDGTVRYCYVTQQGYRNTSIVSGKDYVGGLAGQNGTISWSYFFGDWGGNKGKCGPYTGHGGSVKGCYWGGENLYKMPDGLTYIKATGARAQHNMHELFDGGDSSPFVVTPDAPKATYGCQLRALQSWGNVILEGLAKLKLPYN